MKKSLSFLIALMLLMSLAVPAFSDESELIPDTLFPMPDSVLSVKAFNISTLMETFMLELVGADSVITFTYEDNSAAVLAAEEYKALIEKDFPGFKDSKGNTLEIEPPQKNSNINSFNILIHLNKEPVTSAGKETLGWIDFSSFADVLTEVGINKVEEIMSVSDKANLANIQLRLLRLGDYNPSFEDIRDEYIRKYHYDAVGKEIPEAENVYKNLKDTELELDGVPAYKFSFEIPDTMGRCETLSCAVYVTTNAAGECVRINAYAPKEGFPDADGNPYRPGIEDLCAIIENTYTRIEP